MRSVSILAVVATAATGCLLDYDALTTDTGSASSSSAGTTTSTGDGPTSTSTGAGAGSSTGDAVTTGSSTASGDGGAGGDGAGGGNGNGGDGAGGDGAGGNGGAGGAGGAPPCVDVEGSCEPWFDDGWTRRRRILIDTTGVTEEVDGFPVLVTLDATRIDLAATLAGGGDLRFVADDGVTVLPHDVESWDPAGTSTVWVRVPTIPPEGSGPVVLWLYHGNPAAPAPGPRGATWAPTFTSVHHLSADLADATGNGHDGTAPNAPSPVPGRAGGALAFDGVDDHVVLPQEADYDVVDGLTLSVWVRVASLTETWQAVVTKGDSAWRLQRRNDTDQLSFSTSHAGVPADNFGSGQAVAIDTWQHVAVTYDGARKIVYVDGAEASAKTFILDVARNDHAVALGENLEATGRHFHGAMDEVRIATSAASADWIALEHRTVTDPGMLTFSAEQLPP